MTTLIDTVLPEESYIKNIFIAEVSEKFKEVEYISKSLDGIVSILKVRPESYKAYGPWWPAIKAMIVNGGNLDFGVNIDSDVAQIYSYSNDALTLVGGIIYSNERLENHTVNDAYHYLAVSPAADDTEPYIYESTDVSIDKYGLNG